MRSIDARHRNFIGMAARLLERRQTSGCTASYQGTGFTRSGESYARAMPSRLGTSRIPTSVAPHIWRGENPCSTLPCSSDLHSSACTSPTSASAIAGKTARGGVVGRRMTPMPFLCPARASAVDFLCPSGPLWWRHEIANSYPMALGRYRSGAFRCWRLSDTRRGADRDRRAARDSSRSRHRHHGYLAIVRGRLGDPVPSLPERKQPCSMSS
jgi:hypothetical protein